MGATERSVDNQVTNLVLCPRPPAGCLTAGLTTFQGEASLDRHLVVLNLAVLDMTPGLNNLELTQIFQSRTRKVDRGLNSVLDAGFG